GHRWNHDMKRILGTPTVAGGIGQRADDLAVLVNRAWPPIEQQQRQRIRIFRTLMNEVNVEAINLRLELTELIESAFLCAPLEPIAPVLDEALQISEIHAVVPAGAIGLVRKSRACESRFQILQDLVRNVNRKRNDRRIARNTRRLRRRHSCPSTTACAW